MKYPTEIKCQTAQRNVLGNVYFQHHPKCNH